MHLEDTPLDIGYASERVTLKDAEGKSYSVAGHNGKTQLLITAPFIDKDLLLELKEIEAMIPKDDDNVTMALIVANHSHQNPNIKGLDFYIDEEKEFADWYGVKLIGEPLEGEFTKSIMLISKDGALFHDDYPEDLSHRFNHETLYRKILAAQTCYTGKGCH